MIAVIQGAVGNEFSGSISGEAGPEFPAFRVKGEFTVCLSGESCQGPLQFLQDGHRKSRPAASIKFSGSSDDFQPDTVSRRFSTPFVGELNNKMMGIGLPEDDF